MGIILLLWLVGFCGGPSLCTVRLDGTSWRGIGALCGEVRWGGAGTGSRLAHGKGRFTGRSARQFQFRHRSSVCRFCAVLTLCVCLCPSFFCQRRARRLNEVLSTRIWGRTDGILRSMQIGRCRRSGRLPLLLVCIKNCCLLPSFYALGHRLPHQRLFHSPLALFYHVISRLQRLIANHVNGVLLGIVNPLILLVPCL